MVSKTILFYWSRGADTRRKIIKIIHKCQKNKKPCFLNKIAKRLDLSHVAVKKHLDLLTEEDFIRPINPKGKPVYLKLTKKGKETIHEFNRQ